MTREERLKKMEIARRLRDEGWTQFDIAHHVKISRSALQEWLDPDLKARRAVSRAKHKERVKELDERRIAELDNMMPYDRFLHLMAHGKMT